MVITFMFWWINKRYLCWLNDLPDSEGLLQVNAADKALMFWYLKLVMPRNWLPIVDQRLQSLRSQILRKEKLDGWLFSTILVLMNNLSFNWSLQQLVIEVKYFFSFIDYSILAWNFHFLLNFYLTNIYLIFWMVFGVSKVIIKSQGNYIEVPW